MMAVGNLIFAVLTALVAANFIFAEENPPKLGDFDNDQVEGKEHHNHSNQENHKPPIKENDTETNQEGTISLLFDNSTRSSALSSSSNSTQGPNFYLSCTKDVRCHSTKRGIALKCHGTLRHDESSSSPDSQCTSG